jgi:hypothetical protein
VLIKEVKAYFSEEYFIFWLECAFFCKSRKEGCEVCLDFPASDFGAPEVIFIFKVFDDACCV